MPTTVRWSPRRELMSLREAMDHLLEESLAEKGVRGKNEGRLPIDVYTTPSEIVIQAAIPGVPPEEVSVTIESETLTIRCELPEPLENVEYIFQERPFGKFSRALTLNVPVDTDNIKATFNNGLLTLTLPKRAPAEPKTIKIQTR